MRNCVLKTPGVQDYRFQYKVGSGKLIKAIYIGILLSVLCFPQLPIVSSGTYTQPTILLLGIPILAYGFISQVIRAPHLGFASVIFLLFLWSTVLFYFGSVGSVGLLGKYVGFVQCLFSCYLGCVSSKVVRNSRAVTVTLSIISLIYILFMGVSFVTGGRFESILFSGGGFGGSFARNGRGASPLCPEPSYLVGIIATIVALCMILNVKGNILYLGFVAVLLGTFSVSGLYFACIIIPFIVFAQSRDILKKRSILIGMGIVVFLFMTYQRFRSEEAFEGARFVTIAKNVIYEKNLHDASSSRRWDGFINSVNCVRDNPFGVGFENETLGGLAYLVEVFGVLIVLPLLYTLGRLVLSGRGIVRLYIVLYVSYYIVSGFVYMPIFFFLLGLCLNSENAKYHNTSV